MLALNRTKHGVICEFRSAEILRAACRVFARKGFDGATVDDIADAAGLAKGTVYVYFHSKRELYRTALKRGVAALIEETKRNIDAASTPADKIRAFVTARLRFAEEHRDFVAIYHAEFGNLNPARCNREFKNQYSQQVDPLEAVLHQASLQGQVRPIRAAAAAFFVYELTCALITHRLLGWSGSSVDEDIQLLFDLIWKGLAYEEDTCIGS
jgi:AcrR family transcriptional regulator